MTKELVISANRHETKVAVLEDDQLVEIYFQRANEYSLAGSIHKGRVTRVLPGMQSAFVDLGLERDTFLYVSDFFEESDEYEKLPVEDRSTPSRRGREARDLRDGREGRDRRERERQEAIESPSDLPAETPSESLPVRAAEVESPVETAAEVSSEPVATSEERAERAERRGRRGRRRRGRGGRSFPETKYAEAKTLAAGSSADELAGSPGAEPEAELTVLPGESLAKYSRMSVAAGQPTAGPEAEHFEEEDSETADTETADTETVPTLLENELERAAPVEPETESVDVVQPADSEAATGPGEASLRQQDLTAEEESGEPSSLQAGVETGELAEESRLEADLPNGLDPVVDAASGLTDEQLDQIQLQAEAAVRSEQEGEEDLDFVSASEPEEDDQESASTPDEESARFDAEEEAEESEEGEESELADTTAIDEEFPTPVSESDTTVYEPTLASMENMASSHREQTSRYLRAGRRARRRRGADRNQRPADANAEERSARVERQERTDRGASSTPQVRTVGRDQAAGRSGKEKSQPSITDLLKEGQEIVVQIAKEPLGQKGARITSHVALPGRYCVYMPTVEHLGVSRKIASEEERQRLRRILQTHRQGIPGGFIIRTAGEGKSEEQIAGDIRYLYQLWTEIKTKAESVRAPALLYHDVEIVQRLLRDQLTENFKAIWVDNPEVYETVLRFVQRMQPQMVSRVKLYTRPVPIFDAFNVTAELEKALRPKVWLKSGGYIVINQTEALVAIDVNTGKFVGKSNRLEDTIVKTNIDAVKEIVRQIRLRDLGGIIVVDFIDMDERKNRQKVMQALEEAMKADRAPNKILQFNDFGLVAITRKRVKQSLERALCAPCPTCDGSGYVKSVNTVVGEILTEAQKLAPHIESREVILRVHPSVAVAMKSKETNYLEELEEIFGRPVLVKGDESLHPEKYDLA
ncbi:MAG: Rne/Rng family ribonuclease [Bryobacteraceae bacterium]|nr:Rne/Rng family ribonuclease [Bryobacteraceae bacterium]MDW8376645.1 Rne/Rng family ribonuclease [Bryobacterales bacterium]